MTKNRDQYIRALKYALLRPFYDPLLRWLLREATFKTRLVEQARIGRGHRVLDLGCGTATLTLLIKRAHPETEVVGLDGDVKVLEIAAAKAAKAGLDVKLDHGMAFSLPCPDAFFDRVLSSLLLHHLTTENKLRTLAEVYRVLRPGGELHVADWGKPDNQLMRMAFFPVQILDGFKTTADNVGGLLPDLFRKVGFQKVQESTRYATVLGTLCLYSAVRPT